MQNNVDDDKCFVTYSAFKCMHSMWSYHLTRRAFRMSRKTKTKIHAITTANHKHKNNTFKNQWELNIKLTKLPKARENARTKS